MRKYLFRRNVMKIRKLLIVLAVMAAMVTLLAVYVNAAVIEEIEFGYNHFQSVIANEDNERKDILETLFDGDSTDGGIYDANVGWWGGIDDYILITFHEPTEITHMTMYLVGNWTLALVEFIDENGQVVYFNDENHANSAWSSEPMVFFNAEDESQRVTVKQIQITVKELKWEGYQRTYKISEIDLFGMHEHKYVNYQHVVTPPTCALEGQALYTCNCGDEALLPIDPHGQHIEGERVVFRNGFTNPGYKSTVCVNCDTMDSNITDTIGPLFSTLGYSVREDGTGGIQLGFSPNYENIAIYNELSGTPLQFGTVMGSRAILPEGNPMQIDGLGVSAVQEGLAVKDYTSLGYDIISCRIAGFGEALNATELIISAYIYDGYNIFYLGSDTTSDVTTVSYNKLRGITPEA